MDPQGTSHRISGVRPTANIAGASLHAFSGKGEKAPALPPVADESPPDPKDSSIVGQLKLSLYESARQIKECKPGDEQKRSEILRSVIALLNTENLTQQRLTLKTLSKIELSIVTESLCGALKAEQPLLVAGAVRTLGYLNRKGDSNLRDSIVERIALLLRHSHPEVRAGVCIALRYLDTESAFKFLLNEVASSERSSVVAEREFGFTRRDRSFDMVLNSFRGADGACNPLTLPASFAMLVRSYWIRRGLENPEAREIGVRFGFLDRQTADRLSAGTGNESCRQILERIGIVTVHLLDAYESGTPATQIAMLERWHARREQFEWALLPDDVRPFRKFGSLDIGSSPSGEIDRDLLFSALRENDRMNIDMRCERDPFDSRSVTQIPGRFFFITADSFRNLYFEEYRRLVLSVLPPALSSVSPAALEHVVADGMLGLARADSENREGPWQEATEQALARTRAAAVALNHPEHLEVPEDDQSDPDFIEFARFAVLSPRILDRAESVLGSAISDLKLNELSPGARSVVALELYHLLSTAGSVSESYALSQWERCVSSIGTFEQQAAGLPSIGIELQCNTIPPELIWGWKMAFKHFGIPSPWREDLPGITEASFAPARSGATLECGIRAVRALAFSPPSNLALHISLGLDLGEDAKFLAVPLFLNNRLSDKRILDDNRIRLGLRNVLSKGLVHRNTNCVAVGWGEDPPPARTEIRVCSINEKNHLSPEFLDPQRKLLTSVQLLSACYQASGEAGKPSLKAALWRSYRAQIEQLAEASCGPFRELVAQSWLQSTGDTGHLCLLDSLPIVAPYIEFYKWSCENPEKREELAGASAKIFEATVRRASVIT